MAHKAPNYNPSFQVGFTTWAGALPSFFRHECIIPYTLQIWSNADWPTKFFFLMGLCRIYCRNRTVLFGKQYCVHPFLVLFFKFILVNWVINHAFSWINGSVWQCFSRVRWSEIVFCLALHLQAYMPWLVLYFFDQISVRCSIDSDPQPTPPPEKTALSTTSLLNGTAPDPAFSSTSNVPERCLGLSRHWHGPLEVSRPSD